MIAAAVFVVGACAQPAGNAPAGGQTPSGLSANAQTLKDVTAALKGTVHGLNGKVTVHDVAQKSSTGSDTIGTSTTTTKLERTVTLTVTNSRAVADVQGGCDFV